MALTTTGLWLPPPSLKAVIVDSTTALHVNWHARCYPSDEVRSTANPDLAIRCRARLDRGAFDFGVGDGVQVAAKDA
jgi:hypothetical protein